MEGLPTPAGARPSLSCHDPQDLFDVFRKEIDTKVQEYLPLIVKKLLNELVSVRAARNLGKSQIYTNILLYEYLYPRR
jgi:hypothetical protein